MSSQVERKVFFANVKARDAKGWNAPAMATFHGHKKILLLLLDHNCDPSARNQYGKNAFDLAKDDLDAARAVMTDRSEIRSVLMSWEKEQNPRAAAKRAKLEADAAAEAVVKDSSADIVMEAEAEADKVAVRKKGGGKKGGGKKAEGGATSKLGGAASKAGGKKGKGASAKGRGLRKGLKAKRG